MVTRRTDGRGSDIFFRLSLRCRRGAKLVLAHTRHARCSVARSSDLTVVELRHSRSLTTEYTITLIEYNNMQDHERA